MSMSKYLLFALFLLAGCGGEPPGAACTYWSYGPGGTNGQLASGTIQPDGGCRP